MERTWVWSLGQEDALEKMKEESEKGGLKLNIQKTKIMASSPITSWQIDGETVTDFIFWGSKITANGDCSHEIKRCSLLGRKSDQPRQHVKEQRQYFANNGPSSQGYGFYGSQDGWWELDYKERWALKNWCFCTVVLEKTLEIPLDCKEIQPVHPKGDQSWIFTGKTDAEADTPILWPPDGKNWIIEKYPELNHWKIPWCWERLKWGGKGEDRGWGGWMASLTQWTWVWASSRRWWRTGKPGMLQSMGS